MKYVLYILLFTITHICGMHESRQEKSRQLKMPLLQSDQLNCSENKYQQLSEKAHHVLANLIEAQRTGESVEAHYYSKVLQQKLGISVNQTQELIHRFCVFSPRSSEKNLSLARTCTNSCHKP